MAKAKPGDPEGEAKEKGMVAAIMGAKARLGHTGGGREDDDKDRKEAAEKKRKTMITAGSFDRQVADRMGGSFAKVFVPAIKKLVATDLSHDEAKRLLKIPPSWGAKISDERFRERASNFEPK